MYSNLYRYSILGETLEEALKIAQQKKGIQGEAIDKIWEKFDEVSNKHIKDEKGPDRSRSSHTTQINAIEHEFKFHDGIQRVNYLKAFGGLS